MAGVNEGGIFLILRNKLNFDTVDFGGQIFIVRLSIRTARIDRGREKWCPGFEADT